jgi:hypothetical protein
MRDKCSVMLIEPLLCAIISNTPKVDTLRDTNVVGSTVTVCVDIEPGMTAGQCRY